MAIAEFPLPSVSSSNPIPSCTYQLPDEFQVTSSVYDDGGKDLALQAGGNGIKTWVLEYATVNDTEAGLLDGHVATTGYSPAEGSAYGFNYRDPKTGTLYANVHYAPGGFVRGAHKVKRIQSRKIILIKYP